MNHLYRFSYYYDDNARNAEVPDFFIFDDFGNLHLVSDDQFDTAIYYFIR